MRARTFLALLAAVLLCRSSSAGGFSLKGIYGDDDRVEPSQEQSPTIRGWADSTVALFETPQVTVDTATGKAALQTQPFKSAGVQTPDNPFGQFVALCPEERFRGQAQGAFCSGSLVAPDLVMTAGHCVDSEEECKANIKFVFGFTTGKDGKAPSTVPASEVYGCAAVVSRKLDMSGPDYTLVRLDRAVTGHTPLRVRRSGLPPAGTPLTVIGHPVGLPTKIAGGASIQRDDKGGYLVGNLDTYGGNSGSPVINTVTGEVEGILVRGGTDFVYDAKRQCAKSDREMNDTGRGEDVTLVSNVTPFIPDPAKPAALGSLASLKGFSFDGKGGR